MHRPELGPRSAELGPLRTGWNPAAGPGLSLVWFRTIFGPGLPANEKVATLKLELASSSSSMKCSHPTTDLRFSRWSQYTTPPPQRLPWLQVLVSRERRSGCLCQCQSRWHWEPETQAESASRYWTGLLVVLSTRRACRFMAESSPRRPRCQVWSGQVVVRLATRPFEVYW